MNNGNNRDELKNLSLSNFVVYEEKNFTIEYCTPNAVKGIKILAVDNK